jgi:hypothetical protein
MAGFLRDGGDAAHDGAADTEDVYMHRGILPIRYTARTDVPTNGLRMDRKRSDVAALAAQMIADSGLDYQSAKRKAARQLFGESHVSASMLPDNEVVDHFLLEHLRLFDAGHDERVRRYRRAALHWMRRLEEFNPYLAGSVWKGIVAAHAPIHLQVFTDDAKELEIHLLNEGIGYHVSEISHFAGRDDVPALSFYWERDLPILVSVYRYDDLRGALKRQRAAGGAGGVTTPAMAERGNLRAVSELVAAEAATPPMSR